MGENGIWLNQESRWNDQTTTGLVQRGRPHDMASILKDLRCIRGDGKAGMVGFERAGARMLYDSSYEKKRLRAYGTQRLKELQNWAATCVAASWRGYRGRKRAFQRQKLRNAARSIQTITRGFLSRRRVQRVKFRKTFAVLMIQKQWRRILGSRRFFSIYELRSKNAINLQRIARGRQGRIEWNSMALLKNEASVRIQVCQRVICPLVAEPL